MNFRCHKVGPELYTLLVSYTNSESPQKMLSDDMLRFVFVYDFVYDFADVLFMIHPVCATGNFDCAYI